MSSLTITSLHSHKLKKFEKEIRRHLNKIPNFSFVDPKTNQEHLSRPCNTYMFKHVVDKVYSHSTKKRFPFETLFIYALIYSRRNLKTDAYDSPFEDDYDLILDVVNNCEFVTLSVYDHSFLHKPEKPFWDVCCAVNKKRVAIIPIQFSRNLGDLYPNWFTNYELTQHNKVEVGIDFEMIKMLDTALN